MFNTDNITLDNWDGIMPVRKKPIVVHATQLHEPFEVKTMEGTLHGKAGDYLMIGVDGEKYPIDKEIFEKTYDVLPWCCYIGPDGKGCTNTATVELGHEMPGQPYHENMTHSCDEHIEDLRGIEDVITRL